MFEITHTLRIDASLKGQSQGRRREGRRGESLKAFHLAIAYSKTTTAFPCFPKQQQEPSTPMDEAKFTISSLLLAGLHTGKSVYGRAVCATIPY